MYHKDTLLVQPNYSDDLLDLKADQLPIYQNASFLYGADLEENKFTYSRKNNPNRFHLEKKLAQLDDAKYAFAVSSGQSAISIVFSLLRSNAHIIISNNLYSGSKKVIDELAERYNLEITTISQNDTQNLKFIDSLIKPNTELLFFESPTNPTQETVDINALAIIAKKHHIPLAIDNSLLSSYYLQPLRLGADIAVQSAAKHLGGHNDIMAGVISINDQNLFQQIEKVIQSFGLSLAAFDSWLLTRSLGTLALRMKQQQHSAQKIAQWLCSHQQVNKLYYNQGSVIGFSLKQYKSTNAWIREASGFFNISRNFGSIQSSISLPSSMSHKETFIECQHTGNLSPFDHHLIRLSLGIENVDDIINELSKAFDKVKVIPPTLSHA